MTSCERCIPKRREDSVTNGRDYCNDSSQLLLSEKRPASVLIVGCAPGAKPAIYDCLALDEVWDSVTTRAANSLLRIIPSACVKSASPSAPNRNLRSPVISLYSVGHFYSEILYCKSSPPPDIWKLSPFRIRVCCDRSPQLRAHGTTCSLFRKKNRNGAVRGVKSSMIWCMKSLCSTESRVM